MNSSPETDISSMSRITPSAPDLEFSSEWRCMVLSTSSAVSGLPSWNSTPLRILKVQVTASGEEPTLSANRMSSEPSGLSVASVSPKQRRLTKGTVLAASAGSRELVLSPP